MTRAYPLPNSVAMAVEAALLALDQGASVREVVEQVVRDEREVFGKVAASVGSDCPWCARRVVDAHDEDCPVTLYTVREK